MAPPTVQRLREGSLFTGYNGLGIATTEVLGTELSWVCDNDPAAARLLAHHYPDVPNLGDITTVDWSTVPRVDVLTGGFPCQDISPAGLRLGLRPGTRSGLWSMMAYAIMQLQPPLVVIENVRGLLSAEAHSDMERCPWCVGDGEGVPSLRALGAVLGDLADIGYDAEWVGIRASDVGACHARYRVFILAWPAADPGREAVRFWTGQRAGEPVRIGRGRPDDDRAQDPAADPESDGWDERRPEPTWVVGRPDAAERGSTAPDADGRGREDDAELEREPAEHPTDRSPLRAHPDGRATADPERLRRDRRPRQPIRGPLERTPPPRSSPIHWGEYEPAIRRHEHLTGRPAPAPTEPGRTAERLSPRFVEWMMCLTEGHVTNVPDLTRNEQLRLLGNGVVPPQAATAIRHLLGRLP